MQGNLAFQIFFKLAHFINKILFVKINFTFLLRGFEFFFLYLVLYSLIEPKELLFYSQLN